MEVSVVFAGNLKQAWISVDVADGSDVQAAINQSGVLEQCPEIDLANMRLGIFGKFTRLDTQLKAGDRVEIYRPIIRDLDEDDDD